MPINWIIGILGLYIAYQDLLYNSVPIYLVSIYTITLLPFFPTHICILTVILFGFALYEKIHIDLVFFPMMIFLIITEGTIYTLIVPLIIGIILLTREKVPFMVVITTAITLLLN